MERKIEDIRKAIDNGTYLSALALALTLPDICSQVEYSLPKHDREKYIEWVNTYVKDFSFNQTGFEDFKPAEFAGNVCYSLRCEYLHSGSDNVESDGLKVFIHTFELKMPGCIKDGYGFRYGIHKKPDGTISYSAQIDVKFLCESLCNAAVKFYNDYPDKDKFKDHSCIIES